MGGGRRLRYVNSFRDRHGVMRHYFRRKGKRVRLPDAFGSAEFMEVYHAALGTGERRAERRIIRDKSFDALALRYYASPNFAKLAASSKTNYRRVIESFLAEHGHRRVDQMKREHVDAILGVYDNKQGAGIVLLKRIRTLVRYAIALQWRETDPTLGAKSYESNEIHTINEQEIMQFERRWQFGTPQRVAFDLLLYTGQRVSDAHAMARPDAKGKIQVTQQKRRGKVRLTLAAHPNLVRSLAALPSGNVAALVTRYRRPYTVKGFGNMLSDAMRKADLPARCVPHGLRKAAARRLAEAGCTPHEIMAVTGHKTLAEVERYTRAAGQERLNENALARQLANESVTSLPLQSDKPERKGA